MDTNQPLEQNELLADQQPSKSHTDRVMDAVNIIAVCGMAYAVHQIWVVTPKFIDIFKALRVDLPLSTRLVLALAHQMALIPIFVGVFIFLIYLARRARSREFAIAVMVAALASGAFAYEAITLPLVKIQDQLGKK